MTDAYTFDETAYNIKVIKETSRYLFKQSVKASQALVNIVGVTGIAGFQFDIDDEVSINLESDITDNYIEDNTSIQDHIVLKPVVISMRGFVGTFKYTPNKLKSIVGKVTNTLSLVSLFLPKIEKLPERFKTGFIGNQTQDAQFGLDVGAYGFSSLNLFKDFQDLFYLKSSQTRAFLFFEALRNSRALFSVQTPYKRYDNMAIQTLKPIQDGTTKDTTDFSITFKQLRFTQTTTVQAANSAARRQAQVQSQVNKGIIKGIEKKIADFLPRSFKATS